MCILLPRFDFELMTADHRHIIGFVLCDCFAQMLFSLFSVHFGRLFRPGAHFPGTQQSLDLPIDYRPCFASDAIKL